MLKYIKSSYLFGVTGGLFCLLAFWVLFWLGLDPVDFTLLLACMITPVFVFVGIKSFRDASESGELLFAQGMTVGFMVYFILALIMAFGVGVFLQINQEVFLAYRAEKLAWLQGQESYITENINKEAFEESMRKNQEMSVSDVALDVFLKIFMLELFFTIIISIILKRTKK